MNVMADTLVNLLLERAQESPDDRSYTFMAGGTESEIIPIMKMHRGASDIGEVFEKLGGKGGGLWMC